MTPIERRAIFSLSTLMALRMLGMFMIFPLYSLYASHLIGSTPFLVGLSVGVYGLIQALLQIPLGALSDRIGRKKIIGAGLIVFVIGSFVSACSTTMEGMIMGRALQGMAAVGSAITALMADLTSLEERTKAMAISGITIGLSFSLAMLLGPVIGIWLSVAGLFGVSAIFGLIAIVLLFIWVPPTPMIQPKARISLRTEWLSLWRNTELKRLNAGIFLLHAIFAASFIVIPITLHERIGMHGDQQWKLYFPALLSAFVLTILCVMLSERKKWLKPIFLMSVGLLGITELSLWFFADNLLLSGCNLLLFFFAFSTLEAFLPSLVSKLAPPHQRGMALGIYSCFQFLGVAAGGMMGGWLHGVFSSIEVYLFCALLTILWLTIAFKMKNPQYLPNASIH